MLLRLSAFSTRLVLLLAGGLLLVTGVAYSQSNTTGIANWSTPLKLGDGWWNSIAVDREGNVQVGWYGDVNNMDVLLYARRSYSGEWTETNDVIVTGQGGMTVRNAVAVGSDGTLYAALRAGTSHEFASAYSTIASNAQSWGTPVILSGNGYYIDMTVDRNNVLHVVYSGYGPDKDIQGNTETALCAFCFDLYYMRSTDSGRSWTIPYSLSDLADSGSDRIKIWEAASGRLYVSWDEGLDWYVGRGIPTDVRLRYSDDSGLTWSEPIILDGGDSPGKRPFQGAFTELLDGRLMAVWRYASPGESQVYYQISADDGLTWSIPEIIEGFYGRSYTDSSSTLDHMALETDYMGIVHLFVVGQTDPTSALNVSLYQIEYRQDLWIPPRRVFYDSERRPEWPEVAFGVQNDINLTFFTRKISAEGLAKDDRSDTVALEIWYMHRDGSLLNRPTQAFEPTETPLPTPTVFQKLDPTTTPFPTLEPRESSFSLVTRDTYAIETVLGGVFAAGLFCLAIIVVVRLRR
ncbi:MAG: exo-alpha-sialidase [Anaerolineaceae bacterium]|nr:exo-alpha-sialidase [Anaerolineaceae bacterium]